MRIRQIRICFYDETTITQKEASLYAVVAGKTMRDYYNEESNMQQIKVDEIVIPNGYRGGDNLYVGDMAVVKLRSSISYRNTIVPICIQFRDHAAKVI